MLPDMDGLEVARQPNSEHVDVPIVFLTARGALEDKLRGLTEGADYVTKPFSLEELTARAQRLRQRGMLDQPSAVLQFADLMMDEETPGRSRAAGG